MLIVKKQSVAFLLVSVLALFPFAYTCGMQSGSYRIDEDSVNFGGTEESASASYRLSDTLGEVGTGEGGERCYSMSFDGTNDTVSIGNSSSLNPTSAITISAWVKPAAINQANSPELVAKGGDAHSYRLRMNSTGGIVGSRFYGTTNNDTYTTSSLSTTAFSLITVTYDGSYNSVYKDGVLEAREANSGSISTVTSSLYLGSMGGAGEYFSGLLDDVRVYSRALSEVEVSNLYKGGQIDNTGLVGYWGFDEGSGATTADLSGNGNTGAISGATFSTDVPTATCVALSAGYRQLTAEPYIAISAPDDVVMSPTIGGVTGGTANGNTSWTVTTDNAAGYQVSVRASTTPALRSGAYSFANYTPAGAVPDFTWSVDSTASEFGFTIEGSDTSAKFLDNGSACSSGSGNGADSCWSAFTTSDQPVAAAGGGNHPLGTSTTLKLRAQSGASHLQPSGTYTATVTVTAVAL